MTTQRRFRYALLTIALPLTALVLLPVGYLFVRAAEIEPQRAFSILTRPGTLRVIGRSLLLVLSVSATACLVGVPAAWLTVRSDLKARRLWTVLLTLPLVIPSYIGAFALVGALGPRGMVQRWLQPLGVELWPSIYGFWGAWLALSLFAYPYVFLSTRAGLRGLDPALEEASYTLGRSHLETFWRITLRQALPSISAGALLVALYTLSDFGAVAIMQYNVFTRVIYLRLSLDLDLAALLSVVLVLLTALLLALAMLVERGHGRTASRRAHYRPRPVRLGRWQALALTFCALVVTLALLLPVGVIAYWLVNGLQQGESVRNLLPPLQRSLRASALAALACGLAALPLVWLQVRAASPFTHLLARSAYLGYALPGVVVGLAFVFLGARILGELNALFGLSSYRSLGLLVLAYGVRFLPQALGPARASLLQVNPHLEEVAQTLGRGYLSALITVTLPLMRSGLVAGLALVFLTAMKELPITLLLAPTGYDTLATRIWSASNEAFYARAAAPALTLVLISALSLVYILEPDD
ncbi:MAG: iron ABC transporter permease [Anaerolineae bacterium]